MSRHFCFQVFPDLGKVQGKPQDPNLFPVVIEYRHREHDIKVVGYAGGLDIIDNRRPFARFLKP